MVILKPKDLGDKLKFLCMCVCVCVSKSGDDHIWVWSWAGRSPALGQPA